MGDKLVEEFDDLFVRAINLYVIETFKLSTLEIDEILKSDDFIETLDFIIAQVMQNFTYRQFLKIFDALDILDEKDKNETKEHFVESVLFNEIFDGYRRVFNIINLKKYGYLQQRDINTVESIKFAGSHDETYVIIEYFDRDEIIYKSSNGEIVNEKDIENVFIDHFGFITYH